MKLANQNLIEKDIERACFEVNKAKQHLNTATAHLIMSMLPNVKDCMEDIAYEHSGTEAQFQKAQAVITTLNIITELYYNKDDIFDINDYTKEDGNELESYILQRLLSEL